MPPAVNSIHLIELGLHPGRPSKLERPKLALDPNFAKLGVLNLIKTGVSFAHTRLSIIGWSIAQKRKNLRISVKGSKVKVPPNGFLYNKKQ